MWGTTIVVGLLAGVRPAAAEDCFRKVEFRVDLQVETSPPGAFVVLRRAPDPAHYNLLLGNAPLLWENDYAWTWEEGDCDGHGNKERWGAGAGTVVQAVEQHDYYEVEVQLDGYRTEVIPVHVDNCFTERELLRKRWWKQLRYYDSVTRCTEYLHVVLRRNDAPQVSQERPTTQRFIEGCSEDSQCREGWKCEVSVCVPR